MFLNKGRYGDIQILKPETVVAMQKIQSSIDGSPLDFGLGWWFGKDDFGKYSYHDGTAEGFENTLRIYPDLHLGVVVMGNISGYQKDRIVKGLVSAWTHK